MPQENNQSLDWDDLLPGLYDEIFGLAFKMCESRPQAEDLAQETFLRAWRFQHTLRDTSAVKQWLCRILHNENNRRFRRVRFETYDHELPIQPGDRSYEPDQRAESHLLQRAIAELGDNYREPLMLHVFGGFTGKEIASRLNLNDGAVTTRLFRARAELNRKFGVPP